MSRVGKLPISLPEGVKAEVVGLNVVVSGPRGTIERSFKGDISISLDNMTNSIHVAMSSVNKQAKSMWGTARSIINGMVHGVSRGFSEELEVNGVGYRAFVKGDYLNLTLGKSHGTKIRIPSGLKVEAPKQNIITLDGVDKQYLGQFIALIIKQRPPEPYKGKGIKRKGQYVQRKEGKKN